MNKMKALSLKQPWADCVLNHGKNVDSRSWSTKFRGWIGIHASGKKEAREFEMCRVVMAAEVNSEEVAYGSIIGFAKLADVITKLDVGAESMKWFQGDYGFIFSDVIPLKVPVKVKGMMGLWTLQGDPLLECLVQLSTEDLQRLEADAATREDVIGADEPRAIAS